MLESTEHYGARYLSRVRWMSFVYQVATLSDLRPSRIAEIGIGPGVVGDMIKATYPDCGYTAIDIDPALRPDVAADVTALPFADGAFDAVFCCQVLEHLPYDRFVPALTELKRIVTRLVVSLCRMNPVLLCPRSGAPAGVPAAVVARYVASAGAPQRASSSPATVSIIGRSAEGASAARGRVAERSRRPHGARPVPHGGAAYWHFYRVRRVRDEGRDQSRSGRGTVGRRQPLRAVLGRGLGAPRARGGLRRGPMMSIWRSRRSARRNPSSRSCRAISSRICGASAGGCRASHQRMRRAQRHAAHEPDA